MHTSDLTGFVPAIVTPFSDTGEIIEDAFAEVFEYLLRRGASAVCIAGDNGESWALSAPERGRLVRLAKDLSKGRVPIILGISAPTIDASGSYIAAGEQNGADAFLSMPQTYVLKASEAELMQRFEKVHRLTDTPIILYNSPRRMGFSLSVAMAETLLDNFNVIGIKESQRDFFYHTRLLERLSGRLAIMTGPCNYIMPAYALGAAGFIATGPEFISVQPSELKAIALAAPGDAYREAHNQLTGLYEMLMGVATWPAAFKAALNLIGLPAGIPRDPVLPATQADIDRLKQGFDTLGVPYS